MIKCIMLTQRVDRPQAVEILETNNAALDEEDGDQCAGAGTGRCNDIIKRKRKKTDAGPE
jgi:hypothetical protein